MVDELVERVRERFEAHRDEERAVGMAAYMRDRFPFLGIATPLRRRLSKEATQGLAPPSEAQLRKVVRALWELPEREYQYFATDYAIANAEQTSARFLATARKLITTRSWWDTVDGLAGHLVGGMVARHPDLATEMDRWSRHRDFWLARSAILHQLRYKERTDEARLFDYCLHNASSDEFFLQKAIGVGAAGVLEDGAEGSRALRRRSRARPALAPRSAQVARAQPGLRRPVLGGAGRDRIPGSGVTLPHPACPPPTRSPCASDPTVVSRASRRPRASAWATSTAT